MFEQCGVRRNIWLGAFLVAFVPALIPTIASAQPKAPPSPAAVEEASVRYKRGSELYREENYRGALVEFRKCYEATAEYRVLYNVGQVCYQLQDYVCAVDSFEQYLKDGGKEISEERRRSVEGELNRLRPRIAVVVLQSNVEGATVTIDDVARGKTPVAPIRLSAGSHRLNASKEGYLPFTQLMDVAGADNPTVRIELVASSVAAPVLVPEAPAAPQSQWTTLSYVGLTASGALAIGAAVTGVLALGSASKLKNEQYVGAPSGTANDLQSNVKTYRLSSDILTGAALVTLGTTLYLTLSREVEQPQAPSPKPNVSVNFGLGGASVQGSF